MTEYSVQLLCIQYYTVFTISVCYSVCEKSCTVLVRDFIELRFSIQIHTCFASAESCGSNLMLLHRLCTSSYNSTMQFDTGTQIDTHAEIIQRFELYERCLEYKMCGIVRYLM